MSSRDGVTSGAEWNLDLIDASDDWILSVLRAKLIFNSCPILNDLVVMVLLSFGV